MAQKFFCIVLCITSLNANIIQPSDYPNSPTSLQIELKRLKDKIAQARAEIISRQKKLQDLNHDLKTFLAKSSDRFDNKNP